MVTDSMVERLSDDDVDALARELVEQLRLERGTLDRAPDEGRGPSWRRR